MSEIKQEVNDKYDYSLVVVSLFREIKSIAHSEIKKGNNSNLHLYSNS